jgi:hypothetical protein
MALWGNLPAQWNSGKYAYILVNSRHFVCVAWGEVQKFRPKCAIMSRKCFTIIDYRQCVLCGVGTHLFLVPVPLCDENCLQCMMGDEDGIQILQQSPALS